MKMPASLILTALLSIGGGARARAQGERPAAEAVTAFVGVTVVPADRQRVIPDQTVVIERGRISKLGPAAKVKVPVGATRVDGAGKFLMPGIAEMHGHLPNDQQPEEITRQWLTLFVANGVTTVRGVQGAPGQIALRDRIARGELLGPRLVLYGPALGGAELTPEEGRKRVNEYKQAGFEGLKISEGLSLATYQAIMAEARRLRLPVAGHVPNAVGLARALAAGQDSIEHMDGYLEALAGDDLAAKDHPASKPGAPDAQPRRRASAGSWLVLDQIDEKRIPALVAATRKAGAVVVPTMEVWRTLIGDFDPARLQKLPELTYFHPRTVKEWTERSQRTDLDPLPDRQRVMAVRDRLLEALADAGGLVVLGSDAPQVFSVPGFSLRHETAAMVKAGMSPWQVVESGTAAVARYLKAARDQGTVAVGKRADLILTEGNPLDDVANIFRNAGVMVNGRWLPRAELDRQLAEIATALRYPADAEVKDLPVAASEVAAVVGSYRHQDNTITVARDKDTSKGGQEGLTLTSTDKSGSRTLRLRAQGDGVYLMPEVKAKVTFDVDKATGKATTLVGQQGGAAFRAVRQAQ